MHLSPDALDHLRDALSAEFGADLACDELDDRFLTAVGRRPDRVHQGHRRRLDVERHRGPRGRLRHRRQTARPHPTG